VRKEFPDTTYWAPTITTDAAALQARHAALDAARAEVARLYARWAEFESKQA